VCLISKDDAIEEISKGVWNVHELVDRIKALPSADADGDDLIIKGAKGIQDGLYNIKDGKLFKYKAKGGTVRTYPIVPSAEMPTESTNTPTNTPTDLISRADAIKAVASITMSIHLSDVICDKLLALPSADAEPTVIRSKTLLPTKDFKEWAKRVRETNPNVIVIPCDAEVVSADAVPQLRQTDTLIIADALRYLAKDTERHLVDRTRADALRQQFLKYGASMCSSADAVQGDECDHCVYKWGMKGGAE
jgi:hypothetical protein